MSLPDLQQLKDRLRIEHDVEDDDLELMRASALAFIEEFTGRPIYATERTFVIDGPGTNWDGETASATFFLPLYPVDPATVGMTDGDDVAVDAADFRVNGVTGRVAGIGTASFSSFPMTVTATVGLSLMDGFATRVEPKLAQARAQLAAPKSTVKQATAKRD